MFKLGTKNYRDGVTLSKGRRLLTFGYTSVPHRHYKTVKQQKQTFKNILVNYKTVIPYYV